MDPILHLSLPVRDLAAARTFYVDVLGCSPGRVRDGWIDVWFYGMQVTLHEEPDLVFHHPRPDDPVWSEPEQIVEDIASEVLPRLRT